MLAVLSPFLIYVRGVTGRWTLGAKLTNNSRVRDTLWTWTNVNNNWEFLQVHYRLNDENTQMEDPYWGVSEWHRAQARSEGALEIGWSLVGTPDWRWLGFFTDIFWNVPKPLVPRYAWALIIAGLLLPPRDTVRLRWWLFCLFNFLAMALLAVSLYALPRHELPLLVIFAVAASRGLSAATDLFRRAARSVAHLGTVLSWGAAVVPAVVFLAVMCDSGVDLNRAGNRRPGADRGLSLQSTDARLAQWLGQYLPRGSTLMCNAPWLALWSGMEWRVSPVTEPARLLDYARNKRIDFAAIYAWQFRLKSSDAAVLAPYILTAFHAGDDVIVYDFRRLWQQPAPAVQAAAKQARE
jgi:hypothetical protein